MAQTLEDLRDHLFKTIAELRDKENPMSIERARAVSEVAQTLINSAKAEVDYLKVTDQAEASLPVFGSKETKETPALPPGVTGIRNHRLK